MHFFRAGVADHADDLLAGGAAHDGVVDKDNALPCSTWRTGFSFSFTPKSRTRCSGSMKVRPT